MRILRFAIWEIVITLIVGLMCYLTVNFNFPKDVLFFFFGMWFVESIWRIRTL